MNYIDARTTLLGLASALERRGYDDAVDIREAIDVLSNATNYITTELAVAVGQIAQNHDGGAITIRYDSADPDNIWIVEVETNSLDTDIYRVDDQSGTIVSN